MRYGIKWHQFLPSFYFLFIYFYGQLKERRVFLKAFLKVTISFDDKAVPFNEILISNFVDFVIKRIWLAHIFTARL